MVSRRTLAIVALSWLASACTPASVAPTASAAPTRTAPFPLTNVFVKDFRSSEPQQCTTADVALTHRQAAAFFERAQALSRQQVEDNYPTAPCYIDGTLTAAGQQQCDWRISAAATGFIRCGDAEWHFACDDCDDLFGR